MNMKTSKWYDKERGVVESVTTWETVDDDGVIEHHILRQKETYHGKRYLRFFTEMLFEVTMALDKNSCSTMLFIANKVSRDTNIASVCLSDIEKLLDVSNQTANRIMQELQKADVIRMYRRGQWMFNPLIAAGCYESSYDRLLMEYEALDSYKKKQNLRKLKMKGDTSSDVNRQNSCETSESSCVT